jgi:transposase
VRQAETPQAARWRLTHFLRHARDIIGDNTLLKPVLGALATLEKHAERILARWTSGHSTARLEGLNGLFQAARARARGYRNTTTFAAIIYLIAAPIDVLVST